uniref:tRNA pseudouridine(55) synthase n=1 Tax=Ditylenchus dipsaci TaxID=166011 RepID=A0A915EJN9_9BILA
MVPLCSLCFENLSLPDGSAVKLPDGQHCSFCFGLLDDLSVCEDIIEKAAEQLKLNRYDGTTFLLALNTPITMHLREAVIDKLLGNAFVPMSMSPKGQFSTYLMTKLGQATGLRPTLNSDLVLTVTISNDEFMDSDMAYFRSNFSNALNSGRRGDLMDEDAARRYKMDCPIKKCKITVRLERDATFVGGRYCKYSRSLPQSPWSPDMEADKIINNSVSEKIGLIMMKTFRADGYRFIASGREDIDVRMLGIGRPFAIQLINARSVVPLNTSAAEEISK